MKLSKQAAVLGAVVVLLGVVAAFNAISRRQPAAGGPSRLSSKPARSTGQGTNGSVAVAPVRSLGDAGRPVSTARFADPEARASEVARLAARSRAAKRAATDQAAREGWNPATLSDGGPDGFMAIRNGKPYVFMTHNLNAGISIAVDQVRDGAPYNLRGKGETIGIWDGGHPLGTHQEFGGRVTVMDGDPYWYGHSTHVGGTIGASGVVASAIGMAPSVAIDGYDWTDDLSEMASSAMAVAGETGKIQVSNHSYGPSSGWTATTPPRWYGTWGQRESEYFGVYDAEAVELDTICRNAPYYLPFFSAGNDRGDSAPAEGAVFYYYSGGWQQTTYNSAIHPYNDNWDNGGYDTLPIRAGAKNIVTVGCVRDAVSGGKRSLAGATMTTYSSWGPTDDGRVKPDLVANGDLVYSCSALGNSSYYSLSGCSMSVAAASGSAILLTEYYGRLFPGHNMLASTIKGLMINSADDLGTAGPDYRNGWGMVNARVACEYLRRHAPFPELGILREDSLNSTNLSDSFSFVWTNSGPIKVTLCWTDPAGPDLVDLDDPTPVLVNDLDLRIVDPAGATNFPYVLSPTNPAAAATTGDNVLDNVEQVCITSPSVAGEYVVTVTAHGTLTGGEQQYSLLIGGIAMFPRIQHVPLENTTDTNGPYVLEADISAVDAYESNSPALLWNTNGSTVAFTTNAMTLLTNNSYRTELPGLPRGTAIYYYIAAGLTNGLTSTSPADAPASLHCFKIVNNVSLLVSGSPVAAGVVAPAYGTSFWPSGNVVNASAELHDTPVDGHRHLCRGWIGLGSVPAMGSSNSVGFRINGFSALTWRWAEQYSLSQTSTVAGLVDTQTWWTASSSGSTVVAGFTATVNSTNYCFTEWRLDGTRVQGADGVSVNPVTGILLDSAKLAVAGYLPESLDSDADGLPDWWEVFCFGSTAAMPGDDSDDDGSTNLQEFRDRSNPRDAASVPMPPLVSVSPPADPMTSPAPWTVSAAITDNCALASATLWWIRNAGAVHDAAMSPAAVPGWYECEIPPPGTNGDNFECWVSAQDTAGNATTSTVYSFSLAYPVQVVNPSPLPAIGLLQGTSTNITIAITNAGLANLVWSLAREDVGFADDVESGTNGWSHYGQNDLWHISARRCASPASSWYSGSDADGLYESSMDASLCTPPVYLGPSAMLTFNHRPKTEVDNELAGHTWDGGVVEVSDNGGASFVQVTPAGGYNYLVTPNPASPFAPDTPCYGGTGQWIRSSFDLSAYGGKTALIRFRFGTDAFVVDEGWYIDDVIVGPLTGTNNWLEVSPTNGVLLPGETTNITLTLDSAGFSNGTAAAALLVLRSNDPVTPVSNIVVSLGVGTPPAIVAGPAAQTSTNGYGLVTISNTVWDAEGDTLRVEVSFSTNNGVSWDFAAVRGASASQGGAGVSPSGPPQVTGIVTRAGAVLLTNRVASVWATTNDALGMQLITNALVKTRAWDGHFWSGAVTSPAFTVDNEPPGPPSGSTSSTHSAGEWSTGRVVSVSWLNHGDDGSGGGLRGYGYAFTNTGSGVVPGTVMTTQKQMTSQSLADGSNWWLLVRAVDVFGNAGTVTGSGPYMVDTLPPAAGSATVTVLHSAFGAYVVGGTSITGTWSGFADGGSGIAGYYYSPTNGGLSTGGWWTTETTGAITSLVMDATNRIYVWARDNLGHIGAAAGGSILVLGPGGDWDGDLQLNSQEEVGGSDARNPASVFEINAVSDEELPEGYVFRLAWQAVAGRLYTVYYADRIGDAMTADGSFSNVPSSGGLMAYTNTSPASNRFFRIRVTLP